MVTATSILLGRVDDGAKLHSSMPGDEGIIEHRVLEQIFKASLEYRLKHQNGAL